MIFINLFRVEDQKDDGCAVELLDQEALRIYCSEKLKKGSCSCDVDRTRVDRADFDRHKQTCHRKEPSVLRSVTARINGNADCPCGVYGGTQQKEWLQYFHDMVPCCVLDYYSKRIDNPSVL